MSKFIIGGALFVWYVMAQIVLYYAKSPDATPFIAWAGVLFIYFGAPCLFGAYLSYLSLKKAV